ncbi:hypothetical protein CHGG_05128 [Chaetomium globosum CBS 148.51]|uniref:Nucleoporin NUP49/NSP49 n=1 Tax=Chaetomium globosum (strain ATCC 6205 / CBS 148.51 / DSM 1962 / NBRC 6347 / NRRL 1970) TaxID=306901 RepID=Q2GZB8_CHAGB|nr:uncharacterized protein CHGG_05128 [Chaetomium globosum CBS 148.51]EAQ88509.1 hypothetical protein CHGG_05128 [Chaetomium globosum CBS 148.51]
MSLARSASGPGGLSINTGSANLFPQREVDSSARRLPSPPKQPLRSRLDPSSVRQPPRLPLHNLKPADYSGKPRPPPNHSKQEVCLGQQQHNNLSSRRGGSLGGATTSQPAQAGGLFGGTTQTQQPQQQAGGLFGGAATQQQQQQPQAAGGLFGSSTANTGGMFGNKPAATTTGGGLFGQTQSQPQQSQAGGLSLGQSTAQQQTVPGVRIDLSNIKSTTRFNDLQETLQKEIAQIDEAIQRCIKDKDAVDAFLPSHGEQLAAIPTDVGFVTRKSEGAHNALSSDIRAIDQLRELVKTDAGHARLSFKAIDNLKLPTQYHQAGLWANRGQQVGGAGAGGQGGAADAQSNTDLISFFSATAGEMDDMMKKFERNLGEIEVHLHGVQGNMLEQMQRVAAQSKSTTPGGVDQRVVELAAVLRDFEESILKVAGVVGGVKEGVTELQLKDFMGHGS